MKRVFLHISLCIALCLPLCGAKRQSDIATDFLGSLMNSALMFRPKGEVRNELAAASIHIAPDEWIEIAQVFMEVVQVIQKSGKRREAHLAKLKAQGIEEEPMSAAGISFEIEALGNRFAFDRYGYLHFDDRFVKPGERKPLERMESLYRRFHKRWLAAQSAKAKGGKKLPPAAGCALRPIRPTSPCAP